MRTPKYVGLFRMIPTNASEAEEAKQLANTKRRAAQLESYWRHHAPDWEYQARGYVVRYDDNVDPPHYARTAITAFWNEHGDITYPINDWMAWGPMSENYCGLADLGGNRAAINSRYGENTCGIGTIVHEDGHSNTLLHSGVDNGEVSEYGDDTCIMGGGAATLKGLNSPKMIQMNLDTLRERLVIEGGSQQILLAPIEHSWHTLHPDQYQHVVLKKPGHEDVYLSIRANRGVPFPIRDPSLLYAHYIVTESKLRLQSKRMGGGYTVGRKYGLPNGMVVDYLEYDDASQTARINVLEYADAPVPVELSMPVGFPPALAGTKVTPAHNGVWYNRRLSGQGFDIHIHASQNRMVLFWYTFDKDQRPIYYIANQALDDDKPLTFDLNITKGGTWDNPTTYVYEKVGVAKLYFFDETRGVFLWRTDSYGNGSVEITPTAPLTQHGYNGSWYDRAKPGAGFTVQVFDGRIVMFWYCFDNQRKQRWFSCEGEKDGEVYKLKIYEVFNGEWMYPTKVDSVVVGTAEMMFHDHMNGRFTYTISAGNIVSNGVINLERLF